MSGTEIVLALTLLGSVALNVVQSRWWQADRAEIARMRGDAEAQARADREQRRTGIRPDVPQPRRSNDPGPRAHADCLPGQPCLPGRGDCPYGTPGGSA